METLTKVRVLKSNVEAKPEAAVSYPFTLRLIRFAFSTLGHLFPATAARIGYRLFSTPRTRARHKISDTILEQAKIFEFLYGGQLLKGYEWGQGEHTILLVHGWESRGTALRSFVPSLLNAGFRVVAFDGPAHGNSGGKSTNLPHFSGAVKATINRVGGVYGVIAHSFGGASTVYSLADADNNNEVARLVLVATPSHIGIVLQNFLTLVRAPKVVARHFWTLLKEKFGVDVKNIEVSKLSAKARVGKLLVVHDRADSVVPFAEGKMIADHWENSELLITEGMGHFHLMKNPDVVEHITRFLTVVE